MRISRYLKRSRQFLGDWTNYHKVDVAFKGSGPDVATIVAPWNAVELEADNLMPDGQPVLVEIDARDRGASEIWLGQIGTPSGASDSENVTVQCVGPRAWLSKESVAAMRDSYCPAGTFIRDLITYHPNPLYLELGHIERGKPVQLELRAQKIWEMLEDMRDQTNEVFNFVAIGDGLLAVNWFSQFTGGDNSGRWLIDGINCRWDMTIKADETLEELLAVGEGYLEGTTSKSIKTVAPQGYVVGAQNALGAVLSTAIARDVIGHGETLLEVGTASRAALEAMTEAAIRRKLYTPQPVNFEITDRSLFGMIRANDLWGTRLNREFTKRYRFGVTRIDSVSYGVAPDVSCRCTGTLWAVETQ